jgi:hypothetical protein
MHEIAVNFIRDDDQAEFFGHGAQPPHGRRACKGSCRIVRKRDDDRADLPPGGSGLFDRPGKQVRFRDTAFPARGGNEMRTRSYQGCLCGIADPARLRHRDIAADGEQQAEKEGFASRAAHNLLGPCGHTPAFPVTGRRLPQRRQAGDGTVTPAAGRGGKRLLQRGMDR